MCVAGSAPRQPRGERVFTVVMIFSSLLVVGTGISKMTNAIAELNRASAEARDMKRSLRQVLRTCGVDRATSSRIVRRMLARRCLSLRDLKFIHLARNTLHGGRLRPTLTTRHEGFVLPGFDMYKSRKFARMARWRKMLECVLFRREPPTEYAEHPSASHAHRCHGAVAAHGGAEDDEPPPQLSPGGVSGGRCALWTIAPQGGA